MPQRVEFNGVVHEFPDDFTEADISAALAAEPKPADDGGTFLTPIAAAGIGAAKTTPSVVHGVNRAAKAVEGAAKSKVGRLTPGVIALDAAGDVLRGDVKGAATSAATAAAASQVPKVAAMAQRSTNPAVQRMVRFGGELLPVGARQPGGPLMRGAGFLSRIAGAASLPLMVASGLMDSYTGGQAHAAKLDDPALSPQERDEILRQLHSMGGF